MADRAAAGRVCLAPGVFVEIDDSGRHLKELGSGRRKPVDDWPLEALHELGLGSMDGRSLDPAWRGCADRSQWLCWQADGAPARPAHDAHALSLLRDLDRRFDWFVPELSADARRAYDILQEAHAARRLFRHDFGQCPALPESGLRRALMIQRSGSRRVAVVGDDDLVAVAVAALGVEAVVFDVDEYLLDLVERIAAARGLPVSAARADLREGAAAEHVGAYDCFFADPMSNPDCLGAFVGFGRQLLEAAGRGWVCAHAAAELTCRMQAEIHGFDVVGHWLGFNHYYWSDFRLSDYVSDLFELAPHGEGLAAPPGAVQPGRFYEEVIHRAMAIGRVHLVGIEEKLLSPRSLRRFTVALGMVAEDALLDEQLTVEASSVVTYTAHLRGGVILTVRAQREGGHVEIVCAPLAGELFARIRLATLRFFEAEPKNLHVMRGQGVVSQILEQKDKRLGSCL